ncbi:ATP-binding protein [Melittangium boletus]|uniref:ATP-binding protein n=1 Tax=Melittangium boletus TaxID=83453 RepID=UPI003DA616CF
MSEVPSSCDEGSGLLGHRLSLEAEDPSDILLDLLPDGLFAVDADWRITFVNSVAERLFGRPREALLGRMLWTEFPLLLDTPFGTAYLRARSEGLPLTVECLTSHNTCWYEARAVPWGRGLVVLFRDVTARHLAELARERSASRLALLQEVTVKLCAAASAADVVDVLARNALAALEARSLSIGLPESDRRTLRVLHRDHLAGGPGYRLERVRLESDGALTRVFRSDVPEWQGSVAALPIRTKGRSLAVMCIAFTPPRTFDDADRSFLLSLAHQAGLALERARLYDKEQAACADAERQRARLHALVMQAPMAVSVMRGPSHVIELDNPPHRALLGGLDVVGQPAHEALPGLASLGLLEELDRAYTYGEPFLAREMSVRMDLTTGALAEEHFLHVRYQPLRDASGRVDGVAFFGFDVTDQVRARRDLELAVERQRLLSEASTLLGDSLDYSLSLERLARLMVPRLADWCSVHLLADNGEVELLTRLHRDETHAAVVDEVLRLQPVHLSDASGLGRVLRTGEAELIETCSPEQIRSLAHSPEAARMLASLHISSLLCVPLLARGRVLGALLLVHDDSGRHFSREDLRLAEDLARRAAFSVDNARLYREAQEAIRLRDEFLSIASHELKTPLTSLRLQLSFLERHMPEGARACLGGKLDMAHRQARRLSQLITLLLDVGRIVTGRVSLERSEVDLVRLVREALERLRDMFAGSRSEVTLDAPAPVRGQWDALRLEQVVVNLLSNAAKYGQGRPVTVTVRDDPDTARLVVRDEGIGIAAEDLPRIFDRFERAVSVRHYGGLGLGLYISREIVESHGGRVLVDSAPGQGSTFTVELPRRPGG